MDYFANSIDFKNLSPKQKEHLKKVLKKEVKFLSSILSELPVRGERTTINKNMEEIL